MNLENLNIRNKITFSNSIALALMIGIGAIVIANLYQIRDTSKWVQHTYKVIGQANLLMKFLIDMETGERGFLIAGKPDFLEPYHTGNHNFDKTLLELKETVSDNPEQVARLVEIQKLKDKWLKTVAEPEIIKRKQLTQANATFQELNTVIQAKTGKQLIDEIRGKAKTFIAVEQGLLVDRETVAQARATFTIASTLLGTAIAVIIAFLASFFIARKISIPINDLVTIMNNMAKKGDFRQTVSMEGKDETSQLGDAFNMIVTNFQEIVTQANRISAGDYSMDIIPRSDNDELGIAMQEMTKTLRALRAETEKQSWLFQGQSGLDSKMRGEQEVAELAQNIINFLANYLTIQIGVFYLAEGDSLKLIGSFAYKMRNTSDSEFKLGESLIGQAALEKKSILFSNVPKAHVSMSIHSGMGESEPQQILAHPFMYENQVKGVLGLGASHPFTLPDMELLDRVADGIGIAVHTAQSRVRMKELLAETQRQADALQFQQVELKTTNEELEERTNALELQQEEVGRKNKELEVARLDLEEKAEALELSSRYKSEFLANMSHELRSPLNSILLLSQSLGENAEGNFNREQVEFADTINESGKELLNLINEILDLSKIESGLQKVQVEEVNLHELAYYVERSFKHHFSEKGLVLNIELQEGLPQAIWTDRQRVGQVIKNFMSNALKFTQQGAVTLHIGRPPDSFQGVAWNLRPQETIAIGVTDTGIGIPKNKLNLIFEAFQQVDGSTSRKYGGTGLGLSIAKELVKLLGGGIGLHSIEGQGSTFTVYLPETFRSQLAEPHDSPPLPQTNPVVQTSHREITSEHKKNISSRSLTPPSSNAIHSDSLINDRADGSEDQKVILIIEDDPKFSKILMKLAQDKGFEGLAAFNGETGLQLARESQPTAIILDIALPGMNGWMVWEELNRSAETCHIPVHFISAMDRDKSVLKKGAIGFLSKPASPEDLDEVFVKIESAITKPVKKLLIIDDEPAVATRVKEMINEGGDVESFIANTGEKAIALLKIYEFDCVILDIRLPDITALELLQTLDNDRNMPLPPIIIYTDQELSPEEERALQEHTQSTVLKDAASMDLLLGEVALFLHRVEANLPQKQQEILQKLYNPEQIFKDKVVLVVDDEARNVYALAKILGEYGLKIMKAYDGKETLKALKESPGIDMVLMDMMMPEMDGYETMQAIRRQPLYKKLPIIALTAKAMKEDRRKCLQAGATDYLTKPVDTAILLSMMKVWLSR